ncbi:MAG: hypothetical protein P0Y60_06465 [Candidatus Microbacterium colombiense]|nr:MAG: hypothetical protein P0Y60_06465 [Microbacterium sp.]
MDPWLLVGEWWWIAPVAAGGIAAGAFGVRRRARSSGRRLAVDAARHDLKIAQTVVVEKRVAVKVARADVAHASAERAAGRATPDQLASAKRMLREGERDAKVAAADVRARQARLQAARAAIPPASAPRPLDRLREQHDAIVVRWMQYETDPARQISYPAMTDVKQPATAAYLRAAGQATDRRREAGDHPSPADFSAYRDAVAQLARALDVAEHAARVKAGELPAGAAWQDAAQDALARSAEALDRAAGAAASAFTAWTTRGRKRPEDPR